MGRSCGGRITPRDRVFLVETTSTKLSEEQNSTSTFHTIPFSAARERRRWFVRSLRVSNATPEKGIFDSDFGVRSTLSRGWFIRECRRIQTETARLRQIQRQRCEGRSATEQNRVKKQESTAGARKPGIARTRAGQARVNPTQIQQISLSPF